MSILVKGMKMPETCVECCEIGLRSAIKCERWKALSAGLRKVEREMFCPLVEVPTPHGSLIEREALRNSIFHHLSINGERYLLPAERSIFWNIIKAPTVIEAEGE